MVEGIDYVSSLITQYAFIEALYVRESPSIPSTLQLRRAIVRMYAAALVYLLKAIDYYGQSTSGKSLTPFHASRALSCVASSTSRS